VTWGGRGTAVVARGAVEGAGQETKRGQASAGQSCTGGGGTGLERIKKKGALRGDGCKEQKDDLQKKVAYNQSQASRSSISRSHTESARSEHDFDKFSLIRLTFLR